MKRAGVMAGIGLVGLCAGVIAQSQAPRPSPTPKGSPPAPQTAPATPRTAPSPRSYSLAQIETLWKAARTGQDYISVGSAFEALLKAEPRNAAARVRYADLLFDRFNAPDAEALYQEALKIDPNNAQ